MRRRCAGGRGNSLLGRLLVFFVFHSSRRMAARLMAQGQNLPLVPKALVRLSFLYLTVQY